MARARSPGLTRPSAPSSTRRRSSALPSPPSRASRPTRTSSWRRWRAIARSSARTSTRPSCCNARRMAASRHLPSRGPACRRRTPFATRLAASRRWRIRTQAAVRAAPSMPRAVCRTPACTARIWMRWGGRLAPHTSVTCTTRKSTTTTLKARPWAAALPSTRMRRARALQARGTATSATRHGRRSTTAICRWTGLRARARVQPRGTTATRAVVAWGGSLATGSHL
mmetsp:Transcript_13820/g.57752  ORF Transcript_13820/g.57752 Transcript_13820/m.57752 type:complete len:226 (+) Transcript_13820:589-1266(+)